MVKQAGLRFLALACLSIIFVPHSSFAAREKYSLPELEMPIRIVVNPKFIAIEDDAVVKMYDSKNFQYMKSVGRKGQGPGEFQDEAFPWMSSESLLVNSSNKISFFNFNGDLINEIKHPLGYPLYPINGHYLGYFWNLREGYASCILYDSAFKPLKELDRGKGMFDRNTRRWELFEIFFYSINRDKIVVANRDGSGISIFDDRGNLTALIKPKYSPPHFTATDKANVTTYWTDVLKWPKSYLEGRIKNTKFPENFPPVLTCRLDDDHVYIVTYEKKGHHYLYFKYDYAGSEIKRAYLPLEMTAPHVSVPFDIYGDKLYQLVFNMESDKWELIVDDI